MRHDFCFRIFRAKPRVWVLGFLCTVLSLGFTATGRADEYPSRLVRFIVPYPAGGGIDLLIRAAAQELSKKWNKPVVIENRGGAGGVIGTDLVYRSPPDGYTFLATVNQTMSAAPYLFKALPYEPSKFVPITLMVQADNFILAHPSLRANSLRELVELVKAEPAKWMYGSFGRGSQPQLIFEYLNRKEGLDLLHIPYNGVSPVLVAMIAGEISLTSGSAGVAGEFLRSERLKALAIAGKKRSQLFPDVPTTEEAGFGYLQSSIWYGVFAPPGTTQEIVAKVSGDLRAVLTDPAFVNKQITPKGLDLVASSPAELAETVRGETASLKVMIEAARIMPE